MSAHKNSVLGAVFFNKNLAFFLKGMGGDFFQAHIANTMSFFEDNHKNCY